MPAEMQVFLIPEQLIKQMNEFVSSGAVLTYKNVRDTPFAKLGDHSRFRISRCEPLDALAT